MFPEGIRVRVEEEGVDIFKAHSGCGVAKSLHVGPE